MFKPNDKVYYPERTTDVCTVIKSKNRLVVLLPNGVQQPILSSGALKDGQTPVVFLANDDTRQALKLLYGKRFEQATFEPTERPLVNITGVAFYAPESEKLALGDKYYVANTLDYQAHLDSYIWCDNEADFFYLNAGLVHRNKENAKMHINALIELTKRAK